MDNKRYRVLVVEDDEEDYLIIRELLKDIRHSRFEVELAATYEDALQAIETGQYEVCLLDYMLEARTGLELLRSFTKDRRPAFPIILLTNFMDYEIDIEAMKAGAADFVAKSQITSDLLERVIRYAVERRRTEDALRDSEEKYQSLVEGMDDTVFRMNIDGSFTYLSPQSEVLTGYSRVDLLRMRISDLFAPDLGPSIKAWMARLVSKGVVDPLEVMISRRSGGAIHVEVHASVLLDENDEVDAIQGTIRDLTRRRDLETAQARLAAAIEQTGESVIVTDNKCTVQYVNSAFERISGYRRDEIIGQDVRILKTYKAREAVQRTIRDTLSRGAVWKGRFTNRKKDGTPYEVEATLSPVRDQSGAIINFVGVERDVTHEMLLEKQLLQAQKMEALGTFAGGIAHDFKNLLIPIMLHSELALSDPDLKSSTRDSLERILKSCHNADGLLRSILAFSRPGEEERKFVEMGSCVDDTLKLMETLLPKSIAIHKNNSIPPGRDKVFADSTQLQQVIMNLCNNAVQAMPEDGGVLDLSLECVDRDAKGKAFSLGLEPGHYIMLTVRDTGHGMDETVLGKIFDPFFTTKPKGEGTGLGLAVVYRIINEHGGGIFVSSEPGKGSVFEVYLPGIESTQCVDKPQDKESAPIPRGNERILFVDDEKAVRESVKEILGHLGYKVTLAVGGPAALKTFSGKPDRFDLIITDYVMPKMTGIELAREIVRIRPGIPIILCTAFQGISASEAESSGIRVLAPKPIIIREMAESIRRVLD